jgi:hypothetical protein
MTMTYKYTRLLVLAIMLGGWMASCKKVSPNIFNMFDVQLDLHTDGPNKLSEYTEVNPGDSVVIDFTIHSPSTDMYMICVLKVGSNTPFLKIPIDDPAKRRTFSNVVSLKAEQAGETSYRVWALDKDGVYLGDGYKKITMYVRSDFNHLSNRNMYFPDSADNSLNCYLSLTNASTFNYTNGAEHSANIDLGIYRIPVFNSNGSFSNWDHHIYSLSADPLPFTLYDISDWTRRGTLFSSPTGNANSFRDLHKTGIAIETEAKKKTINLKEVSFGKDANRFVYFLTPEGKYGVLMINSFTYDYESRPIANVSIKIRQ